MSSVMRSRRRPPAACRAAAPRASAGSRRCWSSSAGPRPAGPRRSRRAVVPSRARAVVDDVAVERALAAGLEPRDLARARTWGRTAAAGNSVCVQSVQRCRRSSPALQPVPEMLGLRRRLRSRALRFGHGKQLSLAMERTRARPLSCLLIQLIDLGIYPRCPQPVQWGCSAPGAGGLCGDGIKVHSSSWPGIAVRRTASLRSPMSRPSTSFRVQQDVDARHKAGHDDGV